MAGENYSDDVPRFEDSTPAGEPAPASPADHFAAFAPSPEGTEEALEAETPRRRRRFPWRHIGISALALVFLASVGAAIWLAQDRVNLLNALDDIGASALTMSGDDQSAQGKLIKQYLSAGQYTEAAAAMKAAAAEKQPAGGDLGGLGGFLGMFGGNGSRGRGGAPGAGQPGQPSAPGQPGQPGGMSGGFGGGRRGSAGGAPGPGGRSGGSAGIDPEVLKMIPPQYLPMAQQMLANLPPEQQRALAQQFLSRAGQGGAPTSQPGRPGGPPAGASRSGRGGGGRSQMAQRPSGSTGPSRPSGGRPSGGRFGSPSGSPPGQPSGPSPSEMGAMLNAIPPGINPDMVRTLLTAAGKPEDKGAATALAAFIIARQLSQDDFTKYGQQLAQIMLAGLSTTNPAALGDMTRRFGPFMGGPNGGGPSGGGPGGMRRRGEAPTEESVREAIRQLAPPYYAAKSQGKDVAEVEKALDEARDKLYTHDYPAAMSAVRRAREALAGAQ